MRQLIVQSFFFRLVLVTWTCCCCCSLIIIPALMLFMSSVFGVCMVLIGLVNNYYLKWIVYNLCSVYYVNKNLHRIFLLFCSLHSYTTQTHIYNIPLILQYSIVSYWWINCLIELIWSELMLSSSSSSSFALKIMQIFICEKDIGKICS